MWYITGNLENEIQANFAAKRSECVLPGVLGQSIEEAPETETLQPALLLPRSATPVPMGSEYWLP